MVECINPSIIERSNGRAVCPEVFIKNYKGKDCKGCPKASLEYRRIGIRQGKARGVSTSRKYLEL